MGPGRIADTIASLPSLMAKSGISPLDGVCQFLIDGDTSSLSYFLVCRDGLATARPGSHPAPDATVTLKEHLLAPLQRGQLSIQTAITYGSLVVLGHLELFLSISDALVASHLQHRRALKELTEWSARQPAVTEVARVKFAGRAEIRTALERSTPIVVTESLEAIPDAFRSMDGLEREFPQAEVLTPTGDFAPMAAFLKAVRESSPTDANLPRSGANLYFPLPEEFEAMVRSLPYFPPEDTSNAEFFCSAAGNLTPMHCDFDSGVLAHFFGRKELLLVPPHYCKQLYPAPSITGDYQLCKGDPAVPNLELYPRLAEVSPLRVVLEPGDALVLPWGWFHRVVSLDHVLSIKVNVERALRGPSRQLT